MSMNISVCAVLAFALLTIAVLVLGIGVRRWSLILGRRAELSSFPADEPHGSPAYRRAMRAHANCVENLPVFAAIVFAGLCSGLRSSAMDDLSVVVVAARILQTSVYLASGGNAAIAWRFGFFAVQLVAFVSMGVIVARFAAMT
jgi:uncharacterized MAPEG superfamily protein